MNQAQSAHPPQPPPPGQPAQQAHQAHKVEVHHHYGQQPNAQQAQQNAQLNALAQQQHNFVQQQQAEQEQYQRRLFHSYLLASLALFQLHGLHRFYNGKPISGFFSLITFGGLWIGTFIDFLTMRDLVASGTQRVLPPAAQNPGLPAASVPALPAGNQNKNSKSGSDPTLQVLKLAQAHNGKVTVLLVATELEIPLQEAEAMLDGLVKNTQQCHPEISEEGVVVYDFPAARVTL